MDHFDGVTPEQRWKNDMLHYMRENNRLLNEMLINKEPIEVIEEVTEDDGQMTLDMPIQPSGKKGVNKK